jgi:hypothetical protein
MVTIRAVNNGFIMNYPALEAEEGVYRNNTIEKVYASNEDDVDVFALNDLFYDLMEHFGFYNSKHNSLNLRIEVVDKKGNPVYRHSRVLKSDNDQAVEDDG